MSILPLLHGLSSSLIATVWRRFELRVKGPDSDECITTSGLSNRHLDS